MEDKIDFVILWVDGNDPKWQYDKAKYSPNKGNDVSVNRYRDWKNLQYWFRGVENFAPWVNKVHFVTYGHVPEWLNTEHKKLNIVKHSDFMPNEYLPTFNSRAIELNLNKIPDLSEKFVYFNDDMFIVSKVNKHDFFVKGLPCDAATITQLTTKEQSTFKHTLLNDIGIINRNFEKKAVIKNNFFKFINYRYSIKANLKNFIKIFEENEFSSFRGNHLPAPFLKSTLDQLWKVASEELDETSRHKFRSNEDINQYVFRYWQFVTGNFYPIDIRKFGKGFGAPHALSKAYDAIDNQTYKMICINDNVSNINFDAIVKELNSHFNTILPKKSSFEL